MSRERGWQEWPDACLAAFVAILVVVNAVLFDTTGGDPGVLDYLLLVAGSLVLAARRRAPVVVLLISAACIVGYFLRAGVDVGMALPVLIAVYTAVRNGHRLVAAVVAGTFMTGALVDRLTAGGGEPALEAIRQAFLPFGWFVAAFVLGEAVRQWSAYIEQVEQRAADAERTREETAHRRANEERLHIARELHDSLTHSISVIKVQAGVAVHLAQKRGEDVPASLLAIQDASREAMRELRSTLDVLRTDDGESAANGLDRLPDLVERARSAGLPATVTVRGQRRTLPAAVDRTAYRIVQEALTNITKHAGPASATVRIDYRADQLRVEVDDDGQATHNSAPVPGVGLIGMRERVSALGGRLATEPRPEGGFSVRAELPVAAESESR
jgi:signal transduction histidine kinase